MERDARQESKLHNQLGSTINDTNQLLVKRMANRHFWCGNVIEQDNRRPCFNHVVGLPEKNGKLHPIYDYQMNLINDLESGQKYQAIKKSRGIGLTTLYLRYLAYLGVCKNDIYRNTRFCLVCGSRQAMAEDLIKRLKTILLPLNIVDETERTICRFLNVTTEAFPSARVSTMRSYDDTKWILIDEASFFSSGKEEAEVRAVAEGVPGTVFEQIMEESSNTCLYKRYRLPYTVALNKIYSEEEIDAAKLSPNFEREYNLAYGYGMGNLLLETNIKKCIQDYNQSTAEELSNQVINVGVDIGFSTSKFACVVSTILDGKATILEASEFERVSFSHSVDVVRDIMRRYGYCAYHKKVICMVDGSRPEWCAALKAECGEDPNFQSLLDYSRKYWVPLDSLMNIIPVAFGGEVDRC